MPRLTIYQKPSCSTCRTVMTSLNEAGVDYDAIDYVLEPPSRAKLAELVGKMGISPRDLLRTGEPEYLELGLDDPAVEEEGILDIMAEHPALIQRPILEYGERAALTRPPEKVGEMIADWKLGNH